MARVWREAGIFGLYLVLAIFCTWPWITDLWTQAVGGDSAVYEWSFYWSATSAVGLNNPWFSPDIYAPEGSYLANHSLMLLPALLELPLYGALGVVRSYNVSILIWLALAGYAGYRLALVLVQRRAAAVAAGALYAMGPIVAFRTVQPGMVLLAVLLPFALLAARNLARRRSVGAAVILGLVLAAVFLTDVLISAYVLIAMVGYAVVLLVRSPAWRTRRALMLTGVVLLAAVVPSFGQIVMSVNAERADSYQTPAAFAAASADLYSADAAQFVLPSVFSRHGKDIYLDVGDALPGLLKRVNGPVAIGWATILLAALGLAASWRSPPTRLLALAALACLVLTMGPVVRVLGSEWRPLPVTYKGTEMSALMPYTWLVRTPLVRNVRVPDRFGVVAMLPLAMLAGLGADALLRRRHWWGTGAVAALATFGVIEGRTPLKGDLPIDDDPILAPIKADPNRDSLVVDVPVGWASGTSVTGRVTPAARSMLRGSQHRHPIASGYVARFSPERVKRLLAHPFYLELLRLQGPGRGQFSMLPPECPALPLEASVRDAADLGARWVVLWPDADRAVVPFLRAVGYRPRARSRGSVLMRLGPPVPSALASAPPILRFCTGFDRYPRRRTGRWLIAPQGTMEIGPASGRRRAVTVEVQARSVGRERRMVIQLGGRVLLDRTVGTGPTPVRFRVPAGEGRAQMSLTTTPGATYGSEVVLSGVRVR